MKSVQLLFYIHTVIVVGFENTSVSVGEEIGQFELCVRIFNDISSLPTYTPLNFTLGLVSQTGTAGMQNLNRSQTMLRIN